MVETHHTPVWKESVNQLNKKRKLRTALQVAGALIVLLTFVCKEVLIGELKEASDSLQTAQSKVNTQRSESTISAQIMALSEEMQLYKAKDVAASKDYSAMILQDSTLARQALAYLNGDFESVSQLVDKLRVVDLNGELRRMRDESHEQVDKANKDVNEALMTSSKNDLERMGHVKLALIQPLIVELPLVILESRAMATAQRAQDLMGKVRRILARLSYVFYAIGVVLTLYATLSREKVTE